MRSRLQVVLAFVAKAAVHPAFTVAELNVSSGELLWAPCDPEAGEQPVEYLLLRKELLLLQPAVQVASAIVEVTALQSDEKILSAYKLWVNGRPVTNGPGRNVHCPMHLQSGDDWKSWHCNQTTQGYDTVNVTEAVRSDDGTRRAVLAFQAWSWAGSAPPRGHSSQGGVLALLTLRFSDGSTQIICTSSGNSTVASTEVDAGGPWMTYNATPAFNPGGSVGGMYFQPSENIIMALWPAGWRQVGYAATEAQGWRAAVRSTARTPALFTEKEACAIVQRYRPATALTPVTPANCSGYRYIVDMGRELQGGLQLSINGTGFENHSFTVRLGETLLANGSVRSHMTAGCHYEEVWTLATGLNVFDMGQEYKEWRWAELVEMPTPIDLVDVGAWVVHYPLDIAEAQQTEYGVEQSTFEDVTGLVSTLPYGDADTITSFVSSDDKLNAVWELGRWTILTTSLDVNTDSNTRQRDNCMIDAYIAAMGQFSISKSVQLQRRTLEYAMTNGYNFDRQHGKTWSENHMVTVFAARELLLRDGRAGRKFVEEFYPTLLTLTLSPKYYVEEEGLIVKGEPGWESGSRKDPCWDPKYACDSCEPDLIDSPPKYLDGYCNQQNRSVVINSYSAQTLDALATIATEIGRFDDAKHLSAQASKMRATILEKMVDSETNLFLDGVFSPTNTTKYHSAIASQYFPVGFGVMAQATPAQQARMGAAIMKLVINKTLAQEGEPTCSCMGAHWLLEALYTLARSKPAELSQGASGGLTAQASDAALKFLTHNGTWLGMISAGATSTMEVWRTSDKPNLSWSHPWCSAPANIVPRRLLGVQPLSPGYTHFEVFPQPASLRWAALSLPTLQGIIHLRLNQTASLINITLAIPLGSTARVCLPPAAATSSTAESVRTAGQHDMLTVDGKEVAGVIDGRMLCLPENLTSGERTVARASRSVSS